MTKRNGEIVRAAIAAAALLAAACGAPGGNLVDETPAAEVVSQPLNVTATMVYEGSCAWLACASVYCGNPGCGGTCSDTQPWVARPYVGTIACGATVRVCNNANGRCVDATVRDTNYPGGTWEGNMAVFQAIGASFGDGTCGCQACTGINSCSGATYGWGQANVTITDVVTTGTNNASVSISAPNFVMPGQIQRVTMPATNTGTSTWSGGGSTSMYRLGASTGNGFTFSAFPQCGGYANSVSDARIYTCSSVAPNTSYSYQLDARAPTSGVTSATLSVKMVQDNVAWFGNNATRNIGVGSAYCGTALTQCILYNRPDILPFYQSNGWYTGCSNRDTIVNNWCGIDPTSCNNLKNGACATYNSSCRCYNGSHLGGAAIDPNGTYCGYRVCGGDRHIYTCTSSGWSYAATTCN